MELYAIRGSDGMFYAIFYGPSIVTDKPDQIQWYGSRREAEEMLKSIGNPQYLPPNPEVIKYRLEEVTE